MEIKYTGFTSIQQGLGGSCCLCVDLSRNLIGGGSADQIGAYLDAKSDQAKPNPNEMVRPSYLVTDFRLNLVVNFDRDLLSECSNTAL